MKIREITEYVSDYVHGDVEKQLKKIYKFLSTTKFGKYYFIEDTSYNVLAKLLAEKNLQLKSIGEIHN